MSFLRGIAVTLFFLLHLQQPPTGGVEFCADSPNRNKLTDRKLGKADSENWPGRYR